MISFKNSKPFAESLDAQDPLRDLRKLFYIPTRGDGSEVLYLCGNSLGLQPRTVRTYIEQELIDWERLGVEGHFHAQHPWLQYHELLTEQTARLVGAKPTEVVVMNSLTVNLHLMMVSFYRPTPERYKILIEAQSFPSDRYAVESQLRFHGHDPGDALVELKPRPGELTFRTGDMEKYLETEGHSVALVMMGGVNYYSGQAFEMARITEAGHAQGCVVGFDLAHAAGNLPLCLHEWNVDFAVWCSYKYLSGGPGTIAGCFVHEKYAGAKEIPRFAGWWGHDKSTRFLMGPTFEAISGAEGWQLSNPPIFQLAALRAAMEIFDEVGMERLRQKSVLLTGYLEFLLGELHNNDVVIITPKDPKDRGAQLSIRVRVCGRALFDELTSRGVICDWRDPDVIRVAPVPLYNSFKEVFDFATILKEIMS